MFAGELVDDDDEAGLVELAVDGAFLVSALAGLAVDDACGVSAMVARVVAAVELDVALACAGVLELVVVLADGSVSCVPAVPRTSCSAAPDRQPGAGTAPCTWLGGWWIPRAPLLPREPRRGFCARDFGRVEAMADAVEVA